jgi:hypothetical protein
MPRTTRFHLDENCSKAIAGGLSRRGIDVTTTPDVGLKGPNRKHARNACRWFFTSA